MIRLNQKRGLAQLVSAPRLGRGGRQFESGIPDQMTKDYKIIFCGNGEFGAEVLKQLQIFKYPYPINLVITSADRKISQKQKIQQNPVKIAANKTDFLIKQFKDQNELSQILNKEKPDLAVIADFGSIIKPQDLTIPKFGFLNIHPSYLPKYRGPTPIQTAILTGDTETGVTIFKIDEKIDHGPILIQEKYNIEKTATTLILSKNLAIIGTLIFKECLNRYFNGKLKPTCQNHAQATFTKKIQKTDGQINWLKSAAEIDRQVRALNPWPGTFTYFHGKRLIIHEGRIFENQYIPINVQLEGRKPISWKEFLNGQRMSEEEALKILI